MNNSSKRESTFKLLVDPIEDFILLILFENKSIYHTGKMTFFNLSTEAFIPHTKWIELM